ncbi:MAG: ATP-binding protein [Polyangiales bacterium]
MTEPTGPSMGAAPAAFVAFVGGGEMGELARAFDWRRTSLGPNAGWSASLRSVVQLVLESQVAMLAACGSELTLIYNDAFRALLGRHRSAALGARAQDTFGESWHALGPLLARALAGEAVRVDEQWLHGGPLASPSEHVLSCSPFRDEHGHVLGVLMTAWPLVAQGLPQRATPPGATLNAAAALSRAVVPRPDEEQVRLRLHDLFEQAPVAVSVIRGPGFVFELANRRYEQLVGRSNLVGKPFREAYPELPPDAPVFQMIERIWATGEPFSSNEYGVNLDRGGPAPELVYFHFTCQPVLDRDGTFDSILTVAVDVTEQVEVRHKLEDLAQREELARHVAERASQAKDEFLNTLSHELRTPLSAVVGWAHLLRVGAVADAQRDRALETIERNARAQAKLIEDLLDLARIEQGKVVLAVGPVELPRVIEAALDAVRHAAEAKGVQVTRTLDSHASILGDADRLQQVVWNLLSNAIKFTPAHGQVDVRLRRDGMQVELRVTDSGQGIDAAFLPHVFDRFRQADSAFSRRSGGLGLGLAIVRSLVELHGGTVTAESAGVDRGARFTVRLPIAPLRAASERPSAPPDVARRLDYPASLRGLRALVVDDEPDARELIAFVLGRCELTVVTAGSTAEALAILAREPFDLLISDVGMPGADGMALIREVRRAHASYAAIPALALTAYARSEDRAAALQAGFHMHLAKPIEPTRLVEATASLATDHRPR